MKRSALPIFIIFYLIVGCASTTDKLASAQRDIKAASGIATTVVLLNEDAQERKALAHIANGVATTVYKAADEALDSTAVKDFVMSAIIKSGIKNREAAAYLLGAISELIDDRINIDFSGLADKTTTLRALIRSAASGVIDATKLYLN